MLGTGIGLGRDPGMMFSPPMLSGFVITLLVALSRSQGKLWQNSGKTTPATADGDPVRVATCPYTGFDLTTPTDAARPLLFSEGNGKWSLSFDGVDDTMSYTWGGTVNHTVGSKFRLSAAGSFPMLVALRDAAIEIRAFTTTRQMESLVNDGASQIRNASATALNTWTTLISLKSGSGGTSNLYQDGVNVGSGSDSSTSAATKVQIGSRSGTLPFSGRVAGLVIASQPTTKIGLLNQYLTNL